AYYLGALCVGYFTGYFLLVSGTESAKAWRRVSSATRLANRAVIAAIWIGAIAVPVALASRNLPSIRSANGSLLLEYVRAVEQSFAASGAILPSDYPYVLGLGETHLLQQDSAAELIPADPRLL